jgi:hypothetical protein
MLVDFYSSGLGIILALLYALDEQVSIASTIGPAHVLALFDYSPAQRGVHDIQ